MDLVSLDARKVAHGVRGSSPPPRRRSKTASPHGQEAPDLEVRNILQRRRSRSQSPVSNLIINALVHPRRNRSVSTGDTNSIEEDFHGWASRSDAGFGKRNLQNSSGEVSEKRKSPEMLSNSSHEDFHGWSSVRGKEQQARNISEMHSSSTEVSNSGRIAEQEADSSIEIDTNFSGATSTPNKVRNWMENPSIPQFNYEVERQAGPGNYSLQHQTPLVPELRGGTRSMIELPNFNLLLDDTIIVENDVLDVDDMNEKQETQYSAVATQGLLTPNTLKCIENLGPWTSEDEKESRNDNLSPGCLDAANRLSSWSSAEGTSKSAREPGLIMPDGEVVSLDVPVVMVDAPSLIPQGVVLAERPIGKASASEFDVAMDKLIGSAQKGTSVSSFGSIEDDTVRQWAQAQKKIVMEDAPIYAEISSRYNDAKERTRNELVRQFGHVMNVTEEDADKTITTQHSDEDEVFSQRQNVAKKSSGRIKLVESYSSEDEDEENVQDVNEQGTQAVQITRRDNGASINPVAHGGYRDGHITDEEDEFASCSSSDLYVPPKSFHATKKLNVSSLDSSNDDDSDSISEDEVQDLLFSASRFTEDSGPDLSKSFSVLRGPSEVSQDETKSQVSDQELEHCRKAHPLSSSETDEVTSEKQKKKVPVRRGRDHFNDDDFDDDYHVDQLQISAIEKRQREREQRFEINSRIEQQNSHRLEELRASKAKNRGKVVIWQNEFEHKQGYHVVDTDEGQFLVRFYSKL